MTAQTLMLNALIKQIYKGAGSLTNFLPEGVVLTDFLLPGKKGSRGANLAEWIENIHYSWIEPFMLKVNKALRPYVATALSEVQSTSLSIKRASLNPPLVWFFQRELFAHLSAPDVLPFSQIPSSPLDELLFMPRARVMHLIDLMGIHDVVLDFKRVISKEQQSLLISFFTPLQKQYFEYCMKESLIPLQESKSATFWIEHENPKSLIHSAGLWRLSRLISGEEKSWHWYFIHYLDRARGQQIEKWIEEDRAIPLEGRARDKVLEQVIRLIGALK